MRRNLLPVLFVLIVVAVALAVSACSPVAALPLAGTPTLSPVAPTGPPAATDTPAPSPTAKATETAAPTATPVRRATATRPRPTATPNLAAGVFVTTLKIDPTPAKSNEAPLFTVTFLNTTGQPQAYRWFVKVYLPGQPQSFGETSRMDSDLPPNTPWVKSVSDWKTISLLQCTFFIARVFWADQNNQVTEFMRPDGSSPAAGFNVCP